MIKDILTYLALDVPDDPAAGYATSMAATFAAHVAGVAIAAEPEIAPDGGPTVRLYLERREENEAAAKAAVARFDEIVRRNGLSGETRVLAGTVSEASRQFGQMARRFDLTVIGQARPDKATPTHAVIEAALFESGRPVLVVPYIQKAGFSADRVMVCWDGSRAAGRAVADALPLLARAKSVDVVMVAGEEHKRNEMPGADLAQHLTRHGLRVDIEHITADVGAAAALLNYTADRSIDLIVMGGYGHSRMREFILGGTTRTMLKSMTAPTLMSH
jgi:nucleotide-binding universal stress UspA family protein